VPKRDADPLVEGGAYHKGAAVLVVTKDRNAAKAAAEAEIRTRREGVLYLPEENVLMEQSIAMVNRLLDAQANQYEKDNWVVLKPEVKFRVPMPNSKHHCIFMHHFLYPKGTHEHDLHLTCFDERCQQPIWFVGTTDAVLSWDNLVWLLERKTSSDPRETFWDQWRLDNQPVGYIYGMWKQAGLRPHGFILERMLKPRKNAANPFYVPPPEREPFLVTDARLARFERELTQVAEDYEDAFVRDRWYLNPKSCTDYNRRCYYFDLCQRDGEIADGEFAQREDDYVNKTYAEILEAK
jgi:hypothetical protein